MEYEKFEDLEIVDSREVWWATTLQLECEWNGKKFTVRDAETSKSREFFWIEGEDQFTQEELEEIEEYLYSGEIDLN
tara:strand:+ start:443 stop:673 length:231 start_codon:yes stop_codon:yes gene_type:complete